MSIIPLDRRKAADIVHDKMRELILTEQWKKGERIPSEAALCALFGVSRVTIREAVHRLVGQGIVSIRQGDGTYVEEITPAALLKNVMPLMVANAASIRQTLDFRMLLEVEAARLAARRKGGAEIPFLQDVLEEQRRGGHTVSENALLDQLFHETVAKAADNPLIESNISLVYDIIARGMDDVVGRKSTEDALLYHWLILDAIAQGREEAAAAAMKTHMVKTIGADIAT
jgi:GntR family transcriptional repressor for pyruvate dehydrogenase complex